MTATGRPRTPAAMRKRRRLYIVLTGLTMLGVAAALVLTALEDNIVFFHRDRQFIRQFTDDGAGDTRQDVTFLRGLDNPVGDEEEIAAFPFREIAVYV